MGSDDGFEHLSRAEQIAYNDLKSKKYTDLTFAEKAKLSFYAGKASYFATAPPLQRAAVVGMRSEDSELEDVVDYYSKKNKSEGLSVEELDEYVEKKGVLERKQALIEIEERQEQIDREKYDAAKESMERETGWTLGDAETVKKYEDEHSVLGFMVSSGTKDRIEDAIASAEALTEKQNERSVRGYEIFDPDATENSVGNSYDKGNISTPTETQQKLRASDTIKFPYPEELKQQSHRLVDVGFDSTTGEYGKLIPQKEQKIKDVNANYKKPAMTGKKPEEQFSTDFISKSEKDYNKILNGIFRANGLGLLEDQHSSWMRYIDRSQINIVPHNTETSDITLMTRPSLPMNGMTLLTDSFLAQFNTDNPNSIYYGIRCLLDKKYAATHYKRGPYYHPLSPWLTPVTNGLIGISGFPDPTIETETTEGGYHQEDQTYVKGGLGLYRSQQLQLNFKDIQGGPLMNMFLAWVTIMAQLRDGRIMAYMDDINKNILPYTVGIYHFNLDPTKNYITNWAKCTMCFPISVPFGAIMNKSENQRYITSAGEFSIPFMCNLIHYRQLNDLRAFNIVAKRYYPDIEKAPILPLLKSNNYDGVPYIVNDFSDNKSGGFRLVYKKLPDEYLSKREDLYLSTTKEYT